MKRETKRKKREHRPESDAWSWNLFCVATTGRNDVCTLCGRTCKPQRGHIVPRNRISPEAYDDYPNMEALCGPCNKRYLRKLTPDKRLPGYGERFFFLMFERMRPKISVRLIPGEKALVRLIETPTQLDDATYLIDWNGQPISKPNLEVSTKWKPNLPNAQEAAVILKQFLIFSLVEPPGYHGGKAPWAYLPPRPPDGDEQKELIDIVMANDRDVFWGAGVEYLKTGAWIKSRTAGNADYPEAAWQSWRDFANSFGFEQYAELWRVAVEAEKKKRLEEKLRATEEAIWQVEQAKDLDFHCEIFDAEEVSYIVRLDRGLDWPLDAPQRSRALVAKYGAWRAQQDSLRRDEERRQKAEEEQNKARAAERSKKRKWHFETLQKVRENCPDLFELTGPWEDWRLNLYYEVRNVVDDELAEIVPRIRQFVKCAADRELPPELMRAYDAEQHELTRTEGPQPSQPTEVKEAEEAKSEEQNV